MTIWECTAAIEKYISKEAEGYQWVVEHGRLMLRDDDPWGPVAPVVVDDPDVDALTALAILFDDRVLERAETFRRSSPRVLRCSDCDRPGPRCWRCSLAHQLAYPQHPGELTIEEVFRLAAPMLRREEVA